MKSILIIILAFQGLLLRAQLVESIYVHTDKSSYHTGEDIWLRADVTDADSFRPLGISKVVYAELLDTSGNALMQFKIGIRNGSGNGSVQIPFFMHSGRYILTAYTNWMKNFPPDYYFHKEILILNKNDSGKVLPAAGIPVLKYDSRKILPLRISVNTAKKQYKTRDKITVGISASGTARLSVSVYKTDSLQPEATTSIVNGFSNSPVPISFDFKDQAFAPEYSGHIIAGKIIDNSSGKAAPGVAGFLSVPGKKQYTQIGTSDSLGKIIFREKDFYDVDGVVVQTNILTDSSYHIELDDPFSSAHITPLKDSINISMINSTDRNIHSLSAMVQEIYARDTSKESLHIQLDSFAFYGRPAANYMIEDYVKFTTMEDVLREYVVQVGVQKRNGRLFPFVFDQLRRKAFENSPLYLVDGMPVFEVDRITTMDPLSIRNIEIVDGKFFRGKNVFEGIVSISTKKSDFEMEKNAKFINYQGMIPKRVFKSVRYESDQQINSRLPDFRNVLYWSPEITIGNKPQKIEFYSSDIKGIYTIVVQGITEKGEMGKQTLQFTVN